MKKIAGIFLTILVFAQISVAQNLAKYNLSFPALADKWDEAMPLGDGMLGALVWGKGKKLRLSLDRADLWDERLSITQLDKYNWKWVQENVKNKTYGNVQKVLDDAYNNTYPTKLPAGAMEFNISSFGKVTSNVLDIRTAINTIKFQDGTVFKCFVHASQNQGVFIFENLKNTSALPELITHNYVGTIKSVDDNSHAGADLQKLGYAKGNVKKTANSILYKQPIYDGKYYEILIKWTKTGNKLVGSWTVSNNTAAKLNNLTAKEETNLLKSHTAWWANFWSKSSISVPDTLIQRQYYLEQYKLGSVARKGAPAINLQTVWTADNGSLPPWKGDFHNDLNTQLSYWPTYTSNHLAEGKTYTDWLWKVKGESEKYTKDYFGVEGLNIPGVVTVNGYPMGGWIQYAMSPTVSAWCSQHFYWQWKYSMDKKFLNEQAYPYITQSATFLENITFLKDGVRMLPLSASPEYNNNDITAWFTAWSNFDLGLAKFLFKASAEVCEAKGDKEGRQHWLTILSQLPDFDTNETGFTVAPGQNLSQSHRHMSPYMAIYPLALLDYNKPEDKIRIDNSFRQLELKGTRAWCGYSFSWMASLYARAFQANKAVKQLQIFASNFCSPNSFHLNGDQKGGEYSGLTDRPFTLEGNFAFAQGVNELLLQSRGNYIQVFPAVPNNWKDVSFRDLRAEGAFLISASKVNGVPEKVTVFAEQGGDLKIKLPFKTLVAKNNLGKAVVASTKNGITNYGFKKGEKITFENGYE
ncbi:MAG: glycoside hydrolase N-terminal domain-containing protein [Pedobacter sp.]|nr:glycoside hydrolase N-terminal domain-containing protein [Pedobacter sp.]